jgi:hypothetical protein
LDIARDYNNVGYKVLTAVTVKIHYLLGYDAMQSGGSSLMFWRNALPPF